MRTVEHVASGIKIVICNFCVAECMENEVLIMGCAI